jgi:membrane protein involved in colicin uptake
MVRRTAIMLLAMLPLVAGTGSALGQGAPLSGPNAGAVHGQGWDMRQDLSSSPGPGAADPDRTRRVRQQSAAARQRARTQAQARRAAQQRQQAEQGQRRRAAQTATGGRSSRVPASMAAHEARMADARRRQMEAERAAAEAQDGVRLGR